MSKENLPEKINPARLAEAGASLHGAVLIKAMQRLRSSLASDDGQVDVKIQFGIDQQNIKFLRGHYETQLALQCQRCMETFVYEIIGDFLAGVVTSEEKAKELPDTYEPVMVEDDGMLAIQDLIEDELIVGLPIVPMHDSEDCKVQMPKIVLSSGQGSAEENDNPFKVIEILRKKRESNHNQE
jgi:uncharacterized protein